MAVRKSALLIEVPPQQANSGPVANPETTANAGFTVIQGRADRVDPCALAMDEALGLEMRPLLAVSGWNAPAVAFAWSLAPVVCDLFSLAVKACVELQLNWLSWIPGWQLGTAAPLDSGAEGSTAMESEEHRQSRMAKSMDTAIGAQPAQPGPGMLPYPEAMETGNLADAAESEAAQAAEPSETAALAAGGMR